MGVNTTRRLGGSNSAAPFVVHELNRLSDPGRGGHMQRPGRGLKCSSSATSGRIDIGRSILHPTVINTGLMLDASVVLFAPAQDRGCPLQSLKEPTMTAPTNVVLGGTAQDRRRVVTRLTRRDLPVRVGSRTAECVRLAAAPTPGPPRWTGSGGLYLLLPATSRPRRGRHRR